MPTSKCEVCGATQIGEESELRKWEIEHHRKSKSGNGHKCGGFIEYSPGKHPLTVAYVHGSYVGIFDALDPESVEGYLRSLFDIIITDSTRDEEG